MVDELKATYLNKNPIIRGYSKAKVNFAIKLADLNKQDFILDFGCGAGWLKNKLKEQGYNVIGFDITPEHSDITDYTKINPTKIFALDVFEHIPKEDIISILKNFKKMNPNFELITSIPTENYLSRKARKLLGKSERVKDHITPIKGILSILRSELREDKKINFLTVSYIAKFKGF
ncbi:MAG: methyltransferase domain-containing protein [Nanoarchaeota archaeon]|nr:methyltransferase domain-containing protein [Nanoarchaeota archaeon]